MIVTKEDKYIQSIEYYEGSTDRIKNICLHCEHCVEYSGSDMLNSEDKFIVKCGNHNGNPEWVESVTVYYDNFYSCNYFKCKTEIDNKEFQMF